MQRWDIDERGHMEDPTGEWVKFTDAQVAIAAAVAAERERCAKLCEQCSDNGMRAHFNDLAARIRGQRKCPGPSCQGCMECDGY